MCKYSKSQYLIVNTVKTILIGLNLELISSPKNLYLLKYIVLNDSRTTQTVRIKTLENSR